jgi:hypothetical protein
MAKNSNEEKTIGNLINYDEICFVICPIGEDDSEIRKKSNQVIENIIEPAAQINNLKVLRSDNLSAYGRTVTNQIIDYLLNAKVVIADLSGLNPNVFYELAIRHATFKPYVHIKEKGTNVPFDVVNIRFINYSLDLDNIPKVSKELSKAISDCLGPSYKIDNPIFTATQLTSFFKSNDQPSENDIMALVSRQVESVNISVKELNNKINHPEFFREAIPRHIQEQIEGLFKRYSDELDLLNAIKDAGIVGVFRNREKAFKEFVRDIDAEDTEISIVGSSLKGLLQDDKFTEVRETLKTKVGLKVRIKFLITHPSIADLRVKQERREPTQIGREIIQTLQILKEWGVKSQDVKLYLGTPTAFSMMTSKKMLVNPYPYMFQSYDSPCLILQSERDDRLCYFYNEFKTHHFGAWGTNMSVPIDDFEKEIEHYSQMLSEYSKKIQGLFDY